MGENFSKGQIIKCATLEKLGLQLELMPLFLYYADSTELVTVLLGYDFASLRRSGGDIALGCWSGRWIFHVIQEVLSK